MELLVVMGIIALLMGLLLPSLAAARRTAHPVTCASNLRQLGMALSMYANDNRGWYPRALPLAGADLSGKVDWNTPWPPDLCPICWQAGYPALLAPYLNVEVNNPYAYIGLRKQMLDARKYFDCPENNIPTDDTSFRKCGYPLDYGMYNRASQNRTNQVRLVPDFLMADMTWGMAFVDAHGPHAEPELLGWWVAFVHRGDRINVLQPDYSVQLMDKPDFIKQYSTAQPPVDDPL
jgi:type II secretory pathway pseudopilin PulG